MGKQPSGLSVCCASYFNFSLRMKLTIAFLLQRDTFLKTMGGLIKASLNRKHTTVILYDPTPIIGSKKNQQVTREKLVDLENGGAEIVGFTLEEIVSLCKQKKVDVLVTHEGYYNLKMHLDAISGLRQAGVKVVSLGHFFEIAVQPLDALTFFDKTYYLSDYALDLHLQLNLPMEERDKAKHLYSDRYEVLGSPMFDQVGGLNKIQIKNELGIPIDQPVVVLIAPVISQITNWRYYVWQESSRLKRMARIVRDKKWPYFKEAALGESFLDVMEGIHLFCKRENAVLIVKSRAKQNDPWYMARWADRYYDGVDDVYYPVFSTYKLIAIADVCISSMSMGIIEAVAQSKPALNIYIPPSLDYPALDISIPPVQRAYFSEVMNLEDSPFSFRDSIRTIHRNGVVHWFNTYGLSDLAVNKDTVETYKKKFLGITGEPSSVRILDSLENLKGDRN